MRVRDLTGASVRPSVIAALLALGLPAFGWTADAAPPPRRSSYDFPRRYTNEELAKDPKRREAFRAELVGAMARFLRPGVAYNAASGLTYDGYRIDSRTGALRGQVRNWSAASKESLHVQLLALAAARVPEARRIISPGDPAAGRKAALDILTRKLDSYDKFHRQFPGFGGFLPWFFTSDDGLTPTVSAVPDYDWQDRVPSLDNGQLAWALFLASDVLREEGQRALAQRCRTAWERMARHAPMIFYDESRGKVRGETRIRNPRARPTPDNYEESRAVYHLDDPYEGELMVLFMTLMSYPEDSPEVRRLWDGKKMVGTAYFTKAGRQIPVRKGWCYSAHELWNLLTLPAYRDVPVMDLAFVNGEKARTWYSADHDIPGLIAAASAPEGETGYLGSLGIPILAQQARDRRDVAAPYAAFPVILADEGAGLAWLRNMLAAPRAVGPYGLSEAVTTDGKRITPVVTWDGTVTLALSLMEKDLARLMDRALRREKVYDRLVDRVEEEYSDAFGRMARVTVPFALPTVQIPKAREDFQAVEDGRPEDLWNDIDRWEGGGALLKAHAWESPRLSLPPEVGYLWAPTTHVDLREKPVAHFTVRTEGGVGEGVYLEFKNTRDVPMTTEREEGKLRMEFPNTSGRFQTFSADLKNFVAQPNATLGVLVLSDPGPENGLQVDGVVFAESALPGSTALNFDGRRFRPGHAPAVPPTAPADNLITHVNFHKGGSVSYTHGDMLALRRSRVGSGPTSRPRICAGTPSWSCPSARAAPWSFG